MKGYSLSEEIEGMLEDLDEIKNLHSLRGDEGTLSFGIVPTTYRDAFESGVEVVGVNNLQGLKEVVLELLTDNGSYREEEERRLVEKGEQGFFSVGKHNISPLEEMGLCAIFYFLPKKTGDIKMTLSDVEDIKEKCLTPLRRGKSFTSISKDVSVFLQAQKQEAIVTVRNNFAWAEKGEVQR